MFPTSAPCPLQYYNQTLNHTTTGYFATIIYLDKLLYIISINKNTKKNYFYLLSSSLTLFLYLCRSEFWPMPFSYSLKNVFLTFIAGLFARDTIPQLLFILERLFFSCIALLKYIFSRYSILGWCIFFSFKSLNISLPIFLLAWSVMGSLMWLLFFSLYR